MAVGDAYVFPGFLTPVLTLLFFQSHRLLFSHASAEVRGENTPERKVASTWDRTHNHQVMSPTRSPLSHPGGFHLFHERGNLTHTHPLTRIGLLLTSSPYDNTHTHARTDPETAHSFINASGSWARLRSSARPQPRQRRSQRS